MINNETLNALERQIKKVKSLIHWYGSFGDDPEKSFIDGSTLIRDLRPEIRWYRLLRKDLIKNERSEDVQELDKKMVNVTYKLKSLPVYCEI